MTTNSETSMDQPSAVDSVNGTPDPGNIVIIGAGPAGLTAAYELAKRGIRSLTPRDTLEPHA